MVFSCPTRKMDTGWERRGWKRKQTLDGLLSPAFTLNVIFPCSAKLSTRMPQTSASHLKTAIKLICQFIWSEEKKWASRLEDGWRKKMHGENAIPSNECYIAKHPLQMYHREIRLIKIHVLLISSADFSQRWKMENVGSFSCAGEFGAVHNGNGEWSEWVEHATSSWAIADLR